MTVSTPAIHALREKAHRNADGLTRTEQGYAFWKEDLKTVAEARVQAKGRIAQKRLRELLVDSWALPTIRWMNRFLDPRGNQ